MFSDYTFIIVVIGTVILGFIAGSTGVFSLLRKQALIGDALSHAAFPGVVIAFMLFNTKKIEVLLIGATVAALVAMFLLSIIKKYTKIKFDASMALILSAFFGLGNVLLNSITGASQAGLNTFIFGQATTMLRRDVIIIAVTSIVIVITVIIFWHHIKLYIFNEEFYGSLGFKSSFINICLTIITVLVVVISIKAIGVILMSALLIAPGVAARQWSNKFKSNFFLAGLFGLFSGLIGTIISYQIPGLPTGPSIVVVLSFFVLVSLLFAPKKGLIGIGFRKRRHKKMLQKYHTLIHIYDSHDMKKVNQLEIKELVETGYLQVDNSEYLLTSKGEEQVVDLMRGENLWD